MSALRDGLTHLPQPIMMDRTVAWAFVTHIMLQLRHVLFAQTGSELCLQKPSIRL